MKQESSVYCTYDKLTNPIIVSLTLVFLFRFASIELLAFIPQITVYQINTVQLSLPTYLFFMPTGTTSAARTQASLEVCPPHLLWSRRFDLRQHRRCEISPTPESLDSMLTSSDFQVTMSTNSLYQTVGLHASLYRDATQPQDPHVLPSCLPLKQGSVNITSAKLALYNDFRTRNTIPTAKLYHGRSNCPAQSTLLATGARLFDQVPRTTNHSGRSLLDSLQQNALCPRSIPWTRTSHRP
jgi:hypothetical protein